FRGIDQLKSTSPKSEVRNPKQLPNFRKRNLPNLKTDRFDHCRHLEIRVCFGFRASSYTKPSPPSSPFTKGRGDPQHSNTPTLHQSITPSRSRPCAYFFFSGADGVAGISEF